MKDASLLNLLADVNCTGDNSESELYHTASCLLRQVSPTVRKIHHASSFLEKELRLKKKITKLGEF